MAQDIFEAHSVLGIEIGSVNTRAILFDVVEDAYHFIASGVSPTTLYEPFFDVGDGVFDAISRLQDVTGHVLLDNEGNLLIPSRAGGEGVDRFVITTSCAPGLNIVTFGLLNDVSLDSANKLAYSTYGKVVESIGINDRRPIHSQLDAVLSVEPDLILFAGGTDGGSNRSVLRVSDLISSILQILPAPQRPRILYCGNHDLGKSISETLGRYTQVKVTKNIRPTIDEEILQPALKDLDDLVVDMQYERISGLKRMYPLCSIPPMVSSQAFGSVITFLGTQYDPAIGVLGLDIGGSHSVAAFANQKTSSIHTFEFGLGSGLRGLLEKEGIIDVMKWLDGSRSEDDVRDYLWQRSLYPNAIASSESDLAIELAVTRHILQTIMRELEIRNALPTSRFEPILLSGSVINRTATPQQSLLTILDGIQPLGICPLILDKHAVLSILGAAGRIDPLLPVQVLESTAFTNLATVINAVSGTKAGNTLLHAHLEYADGGYMDAEIKQGSIISLPLASGESGRLTFKIVRRTVIEDVSPMNEPIMVRGGVLGVVIDARGRPIQLPKDAKEKQELFRNWEFMLGGQ